MHINFLGKSQTWFGKVKLLFPFLICVWFIITFADLLTVSNRVRLKLINPRGLIVSDEKNGQFILQNITWENQQLERKRLIRKVCQRYPELRKKVSFGKMFIYDAKKKLAYCRHGKVGTTTWLSHFLTLSNITEPEFSKISASSPLLHRVVPKIFKLTGRGEKLEKIINGTVSFSMVRHPFERLVSAYEDKLVKANASYKDVKKVIRTRFGEVTFTNFVKYILEEFSSEDIVDVHWRPYVSRCNYCNINYSVIAKFETFSLDLAHISAMAGLQFASKHDHQGGDTEGLTTRLFRELPSSLGEKLYKVYEKDFLMFDYDPRKYLDLT